MITAQPPTVSACTWPVGSTCTTVTATAASTALYGSTVLSSRARGPRGRSGPRVGGRVLAANTSR
jgi:hypothetical protein